MADGGDGGSLPMVVMVDGGSSGYESEEAVASPPKKSERHASFLLPIQPYSRVVFLLVSVH